MNSRLIILVAAICISCTRAAPQNSGADQPSEENYLIRNGTNAFTVNLLNQLHHEAQVDENILISPLSIYIALAELHLGSNGASLSEIAKVLNLPQDVSRVAEIHQSLSNVSKVIQSKPSDPHFAKSEVTIANGLFVQQNYAIKEDYIKKIKEYYDGKVTNLDFAKDAKGATNAINQWVSEATKGRITQLYPQPLDSFTVIVLASALFFNGRWTNAFPEYKTAIGKFNTGVKEVDVQFMNDQKSVPYFYDASKQFEAITLAYDGGYKMSFVRPYDTQSLHNLTHQLKPEDLDQILNNPRREGVDFKIPRTKFSYRKQLQSTLSALGLKAVFEKADLSNLAESAAELKVSSVDHAAEIDIDEKGTTASAITSLQISLHSLPIRPKNPKPFHLNKPFLLFIHHPETHTILFAGVVHQPQQ